jgi:hypothetical protein
MCILFFDHPSTSEFQEIQLLSRNKFLFILVTMLIIRELYITQFRARTFPRIPWQSFIQPLVSAQNISKTIRRSVLLPVLLATVNVVTQNINYQDRLHHVFRTSHHKDETNEKVIIEDFDLFTG